MTERRLGPARAQPSVIDPTVTFTGAPAGTGPALFGLRVRKCFVLVGRLHYCHLPKLAVIDLARVFRFET